MFELDMEALRVIVGDKTRADSYTPYPRYPGSQRDLALVADSSVRVGDAPADLPTEPALSSRHQYSMYTKAGVWTKVRNRLASVSYTNLILEL